METKNIAIGSAGLSKQDIAKGSSEFKKKLEQMIETEGGNIGYRAKFLKDQRMYLEAYLEGKIVPPYELEIQPSSICNAACSHCYSNKTIEGAKIAEEKLQAQGMDIIVQRILRAEAHGLRVESIKFVGTCGDPLVNPMTLDAIDMCKDAGRQTSLFTNGIGLLNLDEDGRLYADRIYKIDYTRISLDSGSEKTFQNIKQVPGYSTVLKGIERLSSLRDKHKSPLRIEIGFVITRQNYHEILEACKQVKGRGADSIRYRRDMVGSYFSEGQHDHIQSELLNAKEESTNNFKVLIVHTDKEFENYNGLNCQKCYVPFFWVTVGSDGKLYPCGHRGADFGWSIGDLLEEELLDILAKQSHNPNIGSLPDKDCKVCPPYAARLNPFLHYIAQHDDNPRYAIGIIRDVKKQLAGEKQNGH